MLERPSLPDSNHSKCDNGTDDQETNKRHDTVEIAPPLGALVPRLVEDADFVLVVDMAEAAGAEALLLHLMLWVGGQGEKSGNHPG